MTFAWHHGYNCCKSGQSASKLLLVGNEEEAQKTQLLFSLLFLQEDFKLAERLWRTLQHRGVQAIPTLRWELIWPAICNRGHGDSTRNAEAAPSERWVTTEGSKPPAASLPPISGQQHLRLPWLAGDWYQVFQKCWAATCYPRGRTGGFRFKTCF